MTHLHLELFCSFNPRSREGSDNSGSIISSEYNGFNPRSREGSDIDQYKTIQLNSVSIPAPAKGATMQFS